MWYDYMKIFWEHSPDVAAGKGTGSAAGGVAVGGRRGLPVPLVVGDDELHLLFVVHKAIVRRARADGAI